MSRHTQTVYYYPTEPLTDVESSINEYESNGWHVHQIVPVVRRRRVGDAAIDDSAMFVVYAKEEQ